MIRRIPTWRALLLILGDWRLLKRGFALTWHSLSHFFLPQFQALLMPWLRPVATLSHPLDQGIPFRPKEITTYLGYFSFWFKTLRYLYDRFGRAVLPDIRQSLDDVCLLYREAGAIYRLCQSTTTTRPPMPLEPLYALVYLLDPHLHCIPSLHILLVCYNHYGTSRILRRHGTPGSADKKILEEVGEEARRITEAILLVKQHSVLDIAPSLFLLSAVFPGYGKRAVERLLEGLFTDWNMSGTGKKRLREFLRRSYEGFSGGKGGHRERLLRFLERFSPGGRFSDQQHSPKAGRIVKPLPHTEST